MSAVGAAFSVGAGAGAGAGVGVAAVCARAPEPSVKTPAIAAIATSDRIVRPIAVSFFERLIAFTELFQVAIIADRPQV